MSTATATREEFLAERRTGIGGSDISSVFNIGYGCALRLWREKRGQAPDFPDEATGPMELGVLLEPYFAIKYAAITGRQVDACGLRRHKDQEELLVHVDRMIDDPQRPGRPGVLEIKSVGRGMYFKVKREGLPEDYLLQLQHGMLVTGCEWGSFAVGCRDFGVSKPSDLLWWDVDRDGQICQSIRDEASKFWALVENGPAPDALNPDDRRCQSCGYRTSCQGAALAAAVKDADYTPDESLRPLVMEYVERRALAKEAKDLLEETQEELKTKLADRTMVMAAGAKIQYHSFTKKAYTVPEHTERPLRVYPAKEK